MVAVLSDISIHALRKESDEQSTDNAARGHISIHALRKESDPRMMSKCPVEVRFQSTLSVRRATLPVLVSTAIVIISIHALRKESDALKTNEQEYLSISIHALRKEIDLVLSPFLLMILISIHALRKESDPMMTRNTRAAANFNPRSP